MSWWHPAMPSQRLEAIRFWALRAAEQSREYGEPEPVWAAYLDTADRLSDLLDQRECCRGRYAGCAVLRLRAPEDERLKRNGCFFPLCAAPIPRRNRSFPVRFQPKH